MSPSVSQRKFVVDGFVVATALCRRVEISDGGYRGVKHSQAAGADLKFHGTIADQLPVDLHRHDFLAGHAEPFRLEIFHLRRRDLRGEHDILQIPDDIDVIQPLENDHIEQAVVHNRLLEEREPAAIQPPVSYQHERSFPCDCLLRFDPQNGRGPRGDLHSGNQITERAKIAFESAARFFHGLRIEAHAGELDEMFAIGPWQVHAVSFVLLDNFPATREIVDRQTQLGREDVHRAERQDSERDVVPGDTVYDLVDRSIAARRHDAFVTLRDGISREELSFPRVPGGAECRSARELLDLRAQALGPGAARGRVQNDESIFQR